MQIKVDEKKVGVAFGRMLMLKESMDADTELDTAGAGENYKQGFVEGIEGCIKFLQEAITVESK